MKEERRQKAKTLVLPLKWLVIHPINYQSLQLRPHVTIIESYHWLYLVSPVLIGQHPLVLLFEPASVIGRGRWSWNVTPPHCYVF